jgi:hypothetical protein
MRHKNEKEKEVTRLYNEVVKVSMTDFIVKCVANVNNNVKVSLCTINGERYIPLCTTPDISYFFRRLLEKEEIPATDFIRVFHKTRVITLIKTSTVVKFHDDYIGQLNVGYYIDIAEKIYQLLNDEKLSVIENTISKEAIKKSEEAYAKRNMLIREISKKRREEKAQAENDKHNDEPNANQETLEQLVMKIEAMGWEVTLRMKQHNNNQKIT